MFASSRWANLTDLWVWRPSEIEVLDGRAGECLAPICDLLEDQIVSGIDDLQGGIAWGQFLDRPHHSDEQWGRFGTSAAAQVFAMAHHWDQSERDVYETAPLNILSPVVLPEDPPRWRRSLPKAEDFEDPVKLAFVIDALRLDVIDGKVQSTSPPLVDHLLGMALDTREGWSALGRNSHQRQDRLLITAYALRVLRRFPLAQSDEKIENAWEWLATQLRRRARVLGEDVLALGCLALRTCPRARHSDAVTAALAEGRKELIARVAQNRRPAIDRPYFNPYSRGETNDYLFLSPELLTSMYFLEDDGRPPETRGFALTVVARIVDQIDNENRDLGDPQGFRVQRGMLGTVDQMWAVRVLYAFHCAFRRNPAALRPLDLLVISTGAVLIPVLLAAIAASIALVGGTVGAILATVLGAALSAVLGPFIRRRD